METLQERILAADLKAEVSRIAEWAAHSKARFAQLMDLFLHGEYRVVQRAAWMISMVAKTQPSLVAPHLPAMVQRMQDAGIPVAVKRNVVRVLQFLPVPEALQGAVMEQCFAFLANPQETVAVRAFSMTVLANLARDYPEIKGEIVLLIEDALQQEPTPGIISRAKKVLKMLKA
ncbi:MAG TPA: hypothetical protein VGC22_04175 [Chitinophaga sp.]